MAQRAITTMMIAAGLALGAHAALAQVGSGTSAYGTSTPGIRPTAPTMPSRAGILAATPPLGGPAPALGNIQLSLGSLAPPASGTLGTIAPCPTSGIPISPVSPGAAAPVDAANGVLPASTVGTTFGMLSMAGACNPIVPGAAPTATAPPDPNAAANFANGALPLTATESSSGGLSPLVTVPAPSIPAPPGSVPLVSGPAAALIPGFPIPAISSSGCAGDPSCGGAP